MKGINKVIIVMIAVVAIGAFALPSVMSVGLGQHTFKNANTIRSADITQNCQKCHGTSAGGGVAAELGRSDTNWQYGTVGVTKIHSSLNCGQCHAYNALDTVTHTKITGRPVCVDCHGASQYNGVQNVWAELGQSTEAHNGLANATAMDRNAGCMGCHTAVGVSGSIAFTYDGPAYSVGGLTVGTGAGVPS